MPGYAPLFSVEVRHGYFTPHARLRLRAEPDAATRAWLARTGCVVRTDANALRVWFEADRNGPYQATTARDDGVILRFGLYAQDPQFARFTDGLPPPDRPPLTFCTLCAVEEGNAWRIPPTDALDWAWTEGPRPDLMVVVPLGGPLTPRVAEAARPAQPPLRPAATPALEAVPARAYAVDLRSRESRWKYLLLGDWAEARIVDPLDAVQFEAAPDATLPDGRVVNAFRSKAAIPLAERFEQRFELHAAAAPGGAPVKRVLPVPAAANLARDRGPDGADLIVSEIFVPR